MRGPTIIAVVLVGLGVLCLGAAFASATSIREHVAKTYKSAGTRNEGGGKSLLYDSKKTPSATAKDIAEAVKPADRRLTPSGVFLRYQKDIVSVIPRGPRASRVIVEDERTGYRHGFLYLGGFWGTYSGRGESFRGGGPGAGK